MAPPNISTDNDVKSIESVEHELKDWEAPRAQGLYDPQNEHEACGVGFIVAIDGKRNHKVRKIQFSSSTEFEIDCWRLPGVVHLIRNGKE